MWGGTFLAALLTLLLRNLPYSHAKAKHADDASAPLLDSPRPFSKANSVVCSIICIERRFQGRKSVIEVADCAITNYGGPF